MFMSVDAAQQAVVWSLEEFKEAACEGARATQGVRGFEAGSLEDRWILSRFNGVVNYVNQALEAYRFHEAANRIYDFFWGEFCDWYIELIKPRLMPQSGIAAESVRVACENLVSLFEAALRLLHPAMPFITEEIWQAVYDGKPAQKSIALAAYPQADEAQFDLPAERQMNVLQDLVLSVRQLRLDLKLEPKVKVPIEVFIHDAETSISVMQNEGAIKRLANVQSITPVEQWRAKKTPSRGTAHFDVRLVYEPKIDI